MTNKEAVNWLINITADIGKAEHRDLWHYEQALYEIRDMLESSQPEPCEDAVSREKVIGYFISLWDCIGTIMDRDEWEDVCKTTANELPSVSFPQRHENDHIAEVSKMDCISRQAAIAKLEPWLKVEGYSEGELNMLRAVLYELMFLPSAQPELIRCKDCKHRYIDGKNVRFNVCELNHNKVQSDDWFCADAERREGEADGEGT